MNSSFEWLPSSNDPSPADLDCSGDREFPHFMLREIYQQPAAIQTCLSTYLDQLNQLDQQPNFLCLSSSAPFPIPLQEIHIIASGSSRHAGLIAQFWLEQLANLPTRVRSGSEFLQAPLPLTVKTLTIAVTQSGETADTLQALAFEKQRRLNRGVDYYPWMLGITNQANSSLAQQVDSVLLTLAGQEVGVAATKTFTTQLLVFFLLALSLAYQRQHYDRDRLNHTIAQLRQLPAQIQKVLDQAETIQAMAAPFVEARHCVVLGSGIQRAIALEGALKLKETTYLHAEGYAAGEFMHGPIALLDETVPVIAIVPAGETQATLLAQVQKARSHGSQVMGILTGEPNAATIAQLDTSIVLPSIAEMLAPLLTVIPLQLLAYFIAVARGLDVDRPRNITKTLV